MIRFSRSFTMSAMAAAAMLVSGAAMADPSRITVAMYGGNWGDAFQACVAQPFTKATGVSVVPEIGTSTTTLAKLQQQKNAPTIDVAWLDGGISELAQQAGVLDNLDPAGIPNLKNVVPQGLYRSGGATFAVSSGYYSLGLTYNTKLVKTVPSSWKDLWDKQYAGAVALPSASNSAGVPFVVFLAQQVWGNDPNNLEPVFDKLSHLDAGLLYDSSGAASNAFQSGDVIIGAHFNVGAWDLINKGAPIGFVIPKEGAWATDARLHLIKGSSNKAMAEKFINTALTPEAASCLATRLYLGPAVTGVQVPPDVARKLPWGADGSVNSLKLFDWAAINARRPEIVSAWNRRVANKQ